MATTQISLEEYLRTDYEPDCDYVDGELEERNLGETDHSETQEFIIGWFIAHRDTWHLKACPDLRLRISPTRFRVADLAIVPVKRLYEAVPTQPPLAVVEVLSPEDRFS